MLTVTPTFLKSFKLRLTVFMLTEFIHRIKIIMAMTVSLTKLMMGRIIPIQQPFQLQLMR